MSLGNPQYVEEDRLHEVVGSAPMVTGSPAAAMGVGASGLASVGAMAILLGIWGTLVPLIGPTFGYSADGSVAWNMTSSHLWLAVIPGAVAFVCGFVILVTAPWAVAGSGRGALLLSGIFAVVAGAWFVIGPLAWPVITTAHRYFVPAGPLRELGYQVGYALGTGLLIALAGAFALGWCSRHQFTSSAVIVSRRKGAHSAVGSKPEAPVAPAVVTDRPVVTHEPVLPE